MNTTTVLLLILGNISCAILSYLAGREKEKRDIVKLIEESSIMGIYELVHRIERHDHRVHGKRSHYDARKRQHS